MRCSTVATALVAVFISYLGTPTPAKAGGYDETDLVANKSPLTDKNGQVHTVPPAQVDPNLQNPWGLTSRPSIGTQAGSPFWVSDNGVGLSTLYNVPGANNMPVAINPLVVRIPTPNDPSGGTPTGAVFNIAQAAGAFEISGVNKAGQPAKAPAVFLFVTEDGTIVGWNPGIGLLTSDFTGPNNASTQGIIARNNSGDNFTNPINPSGAVYKGLEIATDGNRQTRLYATNFRGGRVEMYNEAFQTMDSGGPAFVDPKVPASYAPFNIVLIGGELFVTYAVQDAAKHDDVAGQGHGIVDVFDLDGTFHQRFAQHGQLNSPWGVVQAPSSNFGPLAGKLWIGNFGNGHINAYNPDSGEFIDKVRNPKGQAIVIDGLWSLKVGNGGAGGFANTIYFTAGPNDEKDGLFGSLSPDSNGQRR